jgi:tetratricopeptide (TPR) repeat protein
MNHVQIPRSSAIKLGSFAGVAAVAGACHYFGLGEHIHGLLGTALALAGAGLHAWTGHLGVEVVGDIAERAGNETPRGVENRDLHRLIGHTIAHTLEKEAERAPGDTPGAGYLREAAAAFRGPNWTSVELTGPELAVSEPAVLLHFTGDAESILQTRVLQENEWFELVQKVTGRLAEIGESREVQYAAAQLCNTFNFELWEAAKHEWETGGLAWPALTLRLLSLILGHAGEAARNSAAVAGQLDELRREIKSLSDAVSKFAGAAETVAPNAYKEMLQAAIRERQLDLTAKLEQHISGLHARHDKHDQDLQRILAALENRRVAPVKEPLINLPNTSKQILARDREAGELLDALRPDGPGIVSIAAPPGFGKSAVLALVLRTAIPNGDCGQAGLNGIAVLDAKATAPGIASLANLLGRITGLQETAARFQSAAAGHPDASLRQLFFDFLRQAGKVWLVVENAEAVLAPAAPTGGAADFRDLLTAWCDTGHQAKLLLLTRHAMHPAPACLRQLQDVEEALLGGLPEASAVELLRQRLADSRFRTTGEPLLRQIARKLHGVPMALEQFAVYLHVNEQGVDLDQRFLEQNDLLRLRASERMEDLLLRMIGKSLQGLDAASLDLLQVVAWAGMPVPRSGLMGLQQEGAALLTRLIRSNLLLAREGTAAEGRSFDMHPLIREAVAESPGAALDFARIARVFLSAGNSEWQQGQFRPALVIFVLAERAARIAGERDHLAIAIMNRGIALSNLGRLEEAVAAHDESIAINRELVEKEHRQELRNDLARAITNRGTALKKLGRLEEAVAAHDGSIAIYRELVEKEHRQVLRNGLAMAVMNRGIALSNLGRLEEAVAAYGESIAIYRELVQQEHRQELRNDLARAIVNRGNALQNLGRLEEAVAAYGESGAIYRELVEKEHRQELRNDLAMAIMNRGSARWSLGQLEEAVAAYGESIAIYRELVEKEHRQELRNDLAIAIMNRGSARLSLGQLEEAVAAYGESIAIYRELVEKEHRQELRNELARAIMNRGTALQNLGRLEEAVAAHDGSIAIYRELVEKEHRQVLRNDLATAITNRGNALWSLGRLEGAVAAYGESIAIYRELVEKEHRQVLRNDLAIAWYNLALAREKQKAVPTALEAARQARKLWEELVNEGRKHLERELALARDLETLLA